MGSLRDLKRQKTKAAPDIDTSKLPLDYQMYIELGYMDPNSPEPLKEQYMRCTLYDFTKKDDFEKALRVEAWKKRRR